MLAPLSFTCEYWKDEKWIALPNQTRKPKQAALSNYRQEKGLLAVAACLAEQPERIKAMFGPQNYNEKGIYKIMMRFKGEIQEIIIDDYVPLN